MEPWIHSHPFGQSFEASVGFSATLKLLDVNLMATTWLASTIAEEGD